jgi:hydrogenase-4 component B
VSQIGFILVGVGMQCFLGEENALAVRGTFLHMINHSLIKLLLFNAAGVVYMNLHALDFNTVRGFGRKKPFLMGAFLMGALGIGGIPMWNGYVSKTLLHESIVEYIHHLQHLGESVAIFQAIEWAFLISGGLTVAYMLKLFVCLFIEKHPQKQKDYDDKKDYMSLLSKIVIGIAAMVLPILGMFPGLTMDRLADAGMHFMRSGHLHHQVHYFTWVNLKGGLISIAIGVFVYFVMIRKVLIKGGKYIDLWPKKVDIEKLFTKAVWIFLSILGKAAKVMDGIFNEWLRTEVILAVLNSIVKIPEKLPEVVVRSLKITVYRERTERPEMELTNKLHAQYDRKVDTIRLIGSSLSFGLLLACVGLIMTIVYLLMN